MQVRLDNQYRACCALYNLLHKYDGRGAGKRWAGALDRARKVSPDIVDPEATRAPCTDPYQDEYDAEGLSDAAAASLRAAYRAQQSKVRQREATAMEVIRRDFDASGVGFLPTCRDDQLTMTEGTEMQGCWGQLRRKLVSHYTWARAKKLLMWLF